MCGPRRIGLVHVHVSPFAVMRTQHAYTLVSVPCAGQLGLHLHSIGRTHPREHRAMLHTHTECSWLCWQQHTRAGDMDKNIRRPGLEPGTLRFLPIYSRMLLPTELSSGDQAVQPLRPVVCGIVCTVRPWVYRHGICLFGYTTSPVRPSAQHTRVTLHCVRHIHSRPMVVRCFQSARAA